jgi:hypothetical protein
MPRMSDFFGALNAGNELAEFVDAFVRSKIDDIQQDVQKLHIIQDPKIHYDLLRFCQHTRIAFPAMCFLT